MPRPLKSPLRSRRRGAAMVEMAIVAPLLFFFFITAFEFCRVAMIRHTVDNAVYESCRRAIIPGATSGAARDTADDILRTIGLTRTTIKIEPAEIGPQTQEVTITVDVPLENNSFVPPSFTGGKVISRSLTLQRETSGT